MRNEAAIHVSHERPSSPPPESGKQLRSPNPFAQERKPVTPLDLVKYLTRLRDPNIDPYAPASYEYRLFDQLFASRIAEDEEELNRVREFLYAASRFRPTSKEKNVEHAIGSLRHMKFDEWTSRARHAERDSDIDAGREHLDSLKDVQEGLETLEHAITAHLVGEDIEKAVRIVEDLEGSAWESIRAFQIAHGLTWDQALRHRLVDPLRKELECIQPVRDLLYKRRLVKPHRSLAHPREF